MVDDPPDNAVALQLPELLNQHLLRDRGDGPLKIGEAKYLAAEQMEENHKLPAPSKNLNACSTPLAAVDGVCLLSLLEGEYLTFLYVLAIW